MTRSDYLRLEAECTDVPELAEALRKRTNYEESRPIPEVVNEIQRMLERLNRHPLTPLSSGLLIKMPCCGFRFDAEAIDSSPDGPSRVFWPPRWTCPLHGIVFVLNPNGTGLEERWRD